MKKVLILIHDLNVYKKFKQKLAHMVFTQNFFVSTRCKHIWERIRIKRPAAAVIISAILLCSSACSDSVDSEDNIVPDNFPSQTDAEFTGDYSIGMANAECELDYSNIICYTDKEEYRPDDEKITVIVENQNKGKGFYLCDIPNVERYSDGEWVRLNYYPAVHEIEERWAFCAIEGRSDINYSTNVPIWTDKLEDQWTEGEYRAVIYVGREIIYAPFRIVSQ